MFDGASDNELKEKKKTSYNKIQAIIFTNWKFQLNVNRKKSLFNNWIQFILFER